MNKQLKNLIYPKYWLSWVLILIIFIILNCLTQRGRMRLAVCLVPILKLLMPYRFLVSKINIDHCFGHDSNKSKKIYHDHITSVAKGIVESLSCYLLPIFRIKPLGKVEGGEYVEAAFAAKKGVILLGVHSTGLEIGSLFTSLAYPGYGMYRPLTNPVFDYIVYRTRLRYTKGMIPQKDLRQMIKILKQGELIWYASDQDFGDKGKSCFAPFYGISTYTLAFYGQLANKTGAVVIPSFGYRIDKKGNYILKFWPPLLPSQYENEQIAAITMNQSIEMMIKDHEAQYYWLHRRFKTRPAGEEGFYPAKPSRVKRQLKRRKKQLKDHNI